MNDGEDWLLGAIGIGLGVLGLKGAKTAQRRQLALSTASVTRHRNLATRDNLKMYPAYAQERYNIRVDERRRL